jgi:hypothetical protein
MEVASNQVAAGTPTGSTFEACIVASLGALAFPSSVSEPAVMTWTPTFQL